MGKRFFMATITLLLLCLAISCSSSSKSLKISPRSVDFGSVYIGDYIETTIELTNKYGNDIVISGMSLSGSGYVTVENGNTTPILLASDAVHTITIKAEPLTDGAFEANLSIVHDASTKTIEIELSGVGVAVPRIEVSETLVDYGPVLFNTAKLHDIEIENKGSANLNITGFNFTGAGAGNFQLNPVKVLPVIITPGSKDTITVEFFPPTAGIFVATLQITHDAVNEVSPISIDLEGEGVLTAPKITFSNASPWDCGTASTLFPALKELEIENTGSNDLTITSAAFNIGTDYTVVEVQDGNGNVVNLPQTFAVGNKIKIIFKFSPASLGNYSDDLVIIHDAVNYSSPYSFNVTGNGRNVTQKTFTYTGAIENWTVPAGITKLRIEVWGAQGGSASTALGGKGARMRGDFDVVPGDTIKILVGQHGVDSINPTATGHSAGGGGGSFVATSGDQPLICAGGGGGAGSMNTSPQNMSEGDDGTTATDGTAGKGGMPFGTAGDGAPNYTNTGSSGGAGFYTDSQEYSASSYATSAYAFVNGGAGATQRNTGGNGGFGGGGAGAYGGGGGGGYSGGAHGDFHISRDNGAGGGGSINNGSNQDNASGVQLSNGKIVISY